MAKEDLNKRYRFAGDGLGVPGLPHEVSMQEAIDLGAEELLEELIKTGTYVAVSVETTSRSTPAKEDKRSSLTGAGNKEK